MGCKTMRPNWSSKNLTLVPAAIPCLRRSSAGTTSWPFEVNVALTSFMTYILPHVRHTCGGRRSGNEWRPRNSLESVRHDKTGLAFGPALLFLQSEGYDISSPENQTDHVRCVAWMLRSRQKFKKLSNS